MEVVKLINVIYQIMVKLNAKIQVTMFGVKKKMIQPTLQHVTMLNLVQLFVKVTLHIKKAIVNMLLTVYYHLLMIHVKVIQEVVMYVWLEQYVNMENVNKLLNKKL